MAFKPDISDYRESPALKILERLKKEMAQVQYYDPYIPVCEKGGEIFRSLDELTARELEEYDLVVITTAHTRLDYAYVQQHARFIFDTRNATKAVKNKEKIEML